MEHSILKRLATIEQNAIDIDKLETRMARMEAQIQSMGMVSVPEIPEDVMKFVTNEQRQDEELQETMARLAQQYADINNRRELGIPEPGDMTRLSALERIVRWIR